MGNRMGASRKQGFISRMFSEDAEIAPVAQQQGPFQQLLKTLTFNVIFLH